MMDEMNIVETEKTPVKEVGLHSNKIVIFFFLFILIILGVTFAYGYLHFAKIDIAVLHHIHDLEQKTLSNQNELQNLNQTITDLQTAQKKSQEVIAQQEKIISDWQSAQHGNLNRWQVTEAVYLVALANDNMHFTYHYDVALELLQRAQQIIQNLHAENLADVQKSLANDIVKLKNTPEVATTLIYLKLITLMQQVKQLPLAINLLSTQNENAVTAKSLPWWKTGFNYSLDALRKIVIVRHIGNQSLPLIMPEEKNFLYQNLYAQLENAQWAVMHRDADIYQGSLRRATEWIEQYFAQNTILTNNVLKELQSLRAINIKPATINFSDTLRLMNTYLSQSETSKTV